MKVALYARVSLDEKSDDKRFQNPENQLEPLRQWAKSQNWEVFNEYVDKKSGADPNRDFFRLMLQHAASRHFDTILVWRLDRFSREPMSTVLSRIQQLKTRGIGIISQTETWLDTRQENPMSELVLAIMSWAASEERRKISERTKAGIARLRQIGKWKGGRPRKGSPLYVANKNKLSKGDVL